MRPHVSLQGRDIKIADQDRPVLALVFFREPFRHLVEKRQLMGKLVVRIRVRDVAASRDVKIVKRGAILERDGGVAAIGTPAEVFAVGCLKGQARENGDTVIALHAPEMHMAVAECLDVLDRKQIVMDFDFLKADDVRCFFRRKLLQQRHPQADGIYVPGDELHAVRVLLRQPIRMSRSVNPSTWPTR